MQSNSRLAEGEVILKKGVCVCVCIWREDNLKPH